MQRTMKLIFTAVFPLLLLLAGAWLLRHTSTQSSYFTDASYLYKILFFSIYSGYIYWFCQRKYVKKDIGMLVIPCVYLLLVSLPSGIIFAMGDIITKIYVMIYPGYAVAMPLFFVTLYKTIITAIRATK
ncbi:MAG: hypothetical protein IJO94_06035 [Firmicutes bacterium]|nr:hypothetical protein [Bacillota bacterium]